MNLVSPNNVKEWLVTLGFFFVKSRNTLSRFIVLTSFLFSNNRLARQHPNVVKDIQQHTQFLLDKMGAGDEGEAPPQGAGPQQGGPGGDFASDEPSNASWFAPVKPNANQVSRVVLKPSRDYTD